MSHQTTDQTLTPFDGDGRVIRRQWVQDRWYFSVVDVVAALTESSAPSKYWTAMKARIQDEGFTELSTKCRQLKMRSLDGKKYATDAADTVSLLRIVQSIPSPKAEPFKQWLARVGTERLEETGQSDILAGLTPEQKAIFLRGQMPDRNISLAEAASNVGVVTKRDFAIFQDHGYRGLYGGETARDIAARKGVRPGQILDWMNADELTANLFRASQTEQKLRREPIQGSVQANQTHFEVGRAVRAFIIDQGNEPPELAPTPEYSIQELQQREQQRIEAERQPSLWAVDEGKQAK